LYEIPFAHFATFQLMPAAGRCGHARPRVQLLFTPDSRERSDARAIEAGGTRRTRLAASGGDEREDAVADNRSDWAPVPLRLATGACLAYRGAPELFTRAGHENTVNLVRQMGGPMPEASAWGIAVLEFAGGLGLIAGTRVRPIAAAVLGMWGYHVLVALRRGRYTESLPGSPPPPHTEASLLYCGAAAALTLTGPGRLRLSSSSRADR
jgi:uncharacterized membrane protein YphA (DoxX/SURF4 family)